MTDYLLDCPACSFERTVTAACREALDVASEHADGCSTLPADAVVTLERQPDRPRTASD